MEAEVKNSFRRQERFFAWAVIAATVIYFAYFSLLSTLLHESHVTYSYDLGTFDQGVWLALKGETLFVTVRGLHLLGDHVRFISFVIAPLYALFDDVRSLLVLQSAAIASGAYLLWQLGRRVSPKDALVVSSLSLSYLLNPATQNLNLDQAHPDAFAGAFILAAVLSLRADRLLLFWASVSLAMMCKEDVALTVAGLGVTIALSSKTRLLGLAVVVAAAAYFVFSIFVVLPTFNGVGFFRFDYGGFFAGVADQSADGAWLVGRLFRAETFIYLWQLLAPLSFAPLLSPMGMLAVAPALAINLVADASYLRDIRYHYQALVVPLLYVASIDGLGRALASQAWTRYTRRLGRGSKYVVPVALITCALSANFAWSRAPVLDWFNIVRAWQKAADRPEVRDLRYLMASLPHDASVSADYSSVPHLTHRNKIFSFPNPYRARNWGIHDEPTGPESVQFILVRETKLSPSDRELLDVLVAEGRIELIRRNRSGRLYRSTSSEAPAPMASGGDCPAMER